MNPRFKTIKKLKHYASGNTVNIILFILGLLILFSIPNMFVHFSKFPTDRLPLAFHSLRFEILAGIGILTTVIPAFFGIWLVQAASKELLNENKGQELILKYILLNKYLRSYGLILGIVVSLATLATGASRNALISSQILSEGEFPLVIVLLYGGYYTVVLAFLYIPAFGSIRFIGGRLIETIYPLPSPDALEWGTILEKREKLSDVLLLKVSTRQSLETTVSIFGPLLSGFTSFLLQ